MLADVGEMGEDHTEKMIYNHIKIDNAKQNNILIQGRGNKRKERHFHSCREGRKMIQSKSGGKGRKNSGVLGGAGKGYTPSNRQRRRRTQRRPWKKTGKGLTSVKSLTKKHDLFNQAGKGGIGRKKESPMGRKSKLSGDGGRKPR